ncbi:molybdenum-pterin binding domain protein [Burkholderiales bacterium JOSHI_001]|nr:molybdenum-pterin binding domain protein [Burkholderiales bacterium JOSHI_001]
MAPPSRRRPARLRLDGSLWIAAGDKSLGGHSRLGLLRAVAEAGSITQAAKDFGMSYKAAWDAIDAMNTGAGQPLVERAAGGRGGGRTVLTAHGQRLLARYEQVDAVHRRFLRVLDEGGMNLDEDFSLLKVLTMKTSARNQWVGTVSALRAGAVNDEVEISLPGGQRLVAIVTRESTQWLGLEPQRTVIALVKSSSVLLATGLQGARVSARNQLQGTVQAVTPGAVNGEVVLAIAGGLTVVAIVTQAAIAELGLAPGVVVTALVKASDVLLAVVD